MINTHEELRAKARTVNNDPTETDQSEARETDLNVILTRYMQSGTVQSHGKQPMYMDWTEMPEDLRGYLEAREAMEEHKLALPEQLRDIPTEELLYMTPEEIHAKLKPATTQPVLPPKDETSGSK